MATFDVVFEGGGAKGIAFAGALAVFAAQGHTARRVIGTSAGAIASTKSPSRLSQLRTVQRALRLIDTMTGAADNAEIRQHAAEICRLPAKGYGTTEFDMSNERLAALIEGRSQAMTAYMASLRL